MSRVGHENLGRKIFSFFSTDSSTSINLNNRNAWKYRCLTSKKERKSTPISTLPLFFLLRVILGKREREERKGRGCSREHPPGSSATRRSNVMRRKEGRKEGRKERWEREEGGIGVIKISKEAGASLNPIVRRLFIYPGCFQAARYFRPPFSLRRSSPPFFFMNDPRACRIAGNWDDGNCVMHTARAYTHIQIFRFNRLRSRFRGVFRFLRPLLPGLPSIYRKKYQIFLPSNVINLLHYHFPPPTFRRNFP